MHCRSCGENNIKQLVDLGYAPPSNAYLELKDLQSPEIYYPLKVNICPNCFLAQTEDLNKPEDLFTPNYAYFSSTSKTLLKHAENYSNSIIKNLNLNEKSFVVEIASNDGYLLRNFLDKKIPCLGIEPAEETAKVAENLKIQVIKKFFCEKLSKELSQNFGKADLIIGNNVYAHVPNILDFTLGLRNLLNKEGTINLEFPSFLNLIKYNQFDTIYHEHFSYLSLNSVLKIFEKCNLKVYKVEKISTHGGSLRIYGCHSNNSRKVEDSVSEVLREENSFGLKEFSTYQDFQNKIKKIKINLLSFLVDSKIKGKNIVAFGAAAKANTILNYCGITNDLIPYICDSSPAKQNKYLPGSHIQICKPEILNDIKVDYLIIFPWNILEEIKNQNIKLLEKGTKFITLIPEFKIH